MSDKSKSKSEPSKESPKSGAGLRPEDDPHAARLENPMQEPVYSPETPISAGGNVPLGEGAYERELSHVAGGFDPHVRVKEEQREKAKRAADPERHGGSVNERDLGTEAAKALNDEVPESLGPLDREKWKFKRLHSDKQSVSVPRTWLQEAVRELRQGGTHTRRPELVALLEEAIDPPEQREARSGKTASEQVAGTPPNDQSKSAPESGLTPPKTGPA